MFTSGPGQMFMMVSSKTAMTEFWRVKKSTGVLSVLDMSLNNDSHSSGVINSTRFFSGICIALLLLTTNFGGNTLALVLRVFRSQGDRKRTAELHSV